MSSDVIAFFGVLIAVTLSIGLLANFLVRRTNLREVGPWVVCRVAADGTKGMEFLMPAKLIDGKVLWTKDPLKATHWVKFDLAEKVADLLLADVSPLSRFTGEASK